MRKPKILVVEDERVVAADIEESLRKLGYHVVGAAASGVGAIRRAVETEPDLVLMDIKLKGRMDGIDAAQELHERLGIPVVFLTAYADDSILARAKRSSPSGYVLKPFDDRSLRSAVEIALDRHPRERRLRESEHRLATALGSFQDAVVLTGADARVAFLNRAAERLTGWDRAQACGHPAGDVIVLLDRRTGSLKPDPAWRVLREGRSVGIGDDVLLVSRHGTESPVEGAVSPLRDEEGEVVGAAFVFRARRLEEHAGWAVTHGLHHRLETLERLASGAADLLASVSPASGEGPAESEGGCAGATAPQPDPAEETMKRLKVLVEKIRVLASHSADRPRTVALDQLVQDLAPVLPLVAGQGVYVETLAAKKPVHAVARPAALEQAILDLVLLSSRRLPFGGRIEIETDEVELLTEYARAHTRLEAGVYALVSISSAGNVMIPPPNSVEEDCPALGEIVRAMGGDIVLRAEPGRVTAYDVYLAAGPPA